jgi:hypothetical protein
VGKKGPKGSAGVSGSDGAKGLTGPKGRTGLTGKRGAEGDAALPQPAVTGLHKQINSIYQELDIQLRRMAQIQAELNDVRGKLQKMAAVSN